MSCASLSPVPDAAKFRRDPAEVMTLARLGVGHPTRLSFLRVLLRRLQRESWTFARPMFEFDAAGVGHAVYTAKGPDRTYSLVAFGHDLPGEMRSDRVIATAWDATFTLFDGIPDADDLARLAKNVPVQEAGRVTETELTLSRANRSVRLFESVVHALADGRQPDADTLAQTGYLMRTTAVYGSGKFGAASYTSIADRPEVSAPFQAEMLSIWLIRTFTVDLVERMAQARGGTRAVSLDPALRRSLGVGNSTGLGMAPFLVRHPILLNNWTMVREEALARVRAQLTVGKAELLHFKRALSVAQHNAMQWKTVHDIQTDRLADLTRALEMIEAHLANWDRSTPHPWDDLWRWSTAHLPLEGQEALLALMLEPHGDLIDGLSECLGADESTAFNIDGSVSTQTLRDLLSTHYAWAFRPDYLQSDECARFWYVSEDKLEPRLGERHDEPGAEQELPLDIGRQAADLWDALGRRDGDEPIAHFLLDRPDLRPIVRRVQMTASRPFTEIRDNLISADLLPIDMLRCKLAFFGASRFDPRSDRWVRISLFQNCPYPSDLASETGL